MDTLYPLFVEFLSLCFISRTLYFIFVCVISQRSLVLSNHSLKERDILLNITNVLSMTIQLNCSIVFAINWIWPTMCSKKCGIKLQYIDLPPPKGPNRWSTRWKIDCTQIRLWSSRSLDWHQETRIPERIIFILTPQLFHLNNKNSKINKNPHQSLERCWKMLLKIRSYTIRGVIRLLDCIKITNRISKKKSVYTVHRAWSNDKHSNIKPVDTGLIRVPKGDIFPGLSGG